MECFSGHTGNLLIAGAGDLPETHCEIAQRFASSCCLDISKHSLLICSQKLGRKSNYILGSALNIPVANDVFDAVYCAHMIYHIEKDLQSKAIRELLRVMRPADRAVIIYRNPHALPERIVRIKPRLFRLGHRQDEQVTDVPPLYFHVHPLNWWDQFRDASHISLPWDIMSAERERSLFISGNRARWVYRICAWYEKHYPKTAARLWSYVIIVLDKRQ